MRPIALLLCLWPLLSVWANVEQVAVCNAKTEFECGHQIGKQMRSHIRRAVMESLDLFSYYLTTTEGAAVFAAYWELNEKAYPDIVAEYDGMAFGAGVTLHDILVAAFSNELSYHLELAREGHAPHSKSCTDYHVLDRAGNFSAWGHNEDGSPGTMNQTYLMHGSISGFSFIGFAYPAQVVGWAWGVNSHGLAQSVNAVAVQPGTISIGIGINFLARDVLNANSLDDAIDRACAKPVASGLTLNVGSIYNKDLQLLIETSPKGCQWRELATSVENPEVVAFHTNHFQSHYLSGTSTTGGTATGELPTAAAHPSSLHRDARLGVIPPATSLDSLRAVLSDVQDAKYPIHRSGREPDICATMNSVIFDVINEQVLIWGQSAPSGSPPYLVVDWRTMQPQSNAAWV